LTILAALLWTALVVALTAWAIPVWAQPVGCALGPCPGPQRSTVEWFPSLATGAFGASFIVALLVGVVQLVRRAIELMSN
jgi:hypothetical protein